MSGEFVNIEGKSTPSLTLRGLSYGDEYYGTFFRSLYTLFQVLTGESWSEMVARPLVFGSGQAAIGTMFYVSFILICGIVLINVRARGPTERPRRSAPQRSASHPRSSPAALRPFSSRLLLHDLRSPPLPHSRSSPPLFHSRSSPIPRHTSRAQVVVAVLLDKMMDGITDDEPLDREKLATELFKSLDVDGGGEPSH